LFNEVFKVKFPDRSRRVADQLEDSHDTSRPHLNVCSSTESDVENRGTAPTNSPTAPTGYRQKEDNDEVHGDHLREQGVVGVVRS
jgi:hypothetical protein